MCEIKINQILHKNPELKKSLNRFNFYPFIQAVLSFLSQQVVFHNCKIVEYEY